MCFSDNMEDELRFGADHYLKKLLERKSFMESFWGGIKVTCVFMALVITLEYVKNLIGQIQCLN